METEDVFSSYFGRTRQHSLAGIQLGAAGLLNLFYLGASFAYDRAHARVEYHELDGDRAASWNGGLVERLVVDPADNETKRLPSR
jgi:hypothetical protein